MSAPLTPEQRAYARVLWRRRRMPRLVHVYRSCWVADMLGCAAFIGIVALVWVAAQIWSNTP